MPIKSLLLDRVLLIDSAPPICLSSYRRAIRQKVRSKARNSTHWSSREKTGSSTYKEFYRPPPHTQTLSFPHIPDPIRKSRFDFYTTCIFLCCWPSGRVMGRGHPLNFPQNFAQVDGISNTALLLLLQSRSFGRSSSVSEWILVVVGVIVVLEHESWRCCTSAPGQENVLVLAGSD